tara:strand:- start:38 stop:919 length:882 start_codon:yes stop_codon:yes gene_type:complete
MPKAPTFSHLRVADLKIFAKKYNRSVKKPQRIVITGLRKKQLVAAINDKMMNHASTTDLMNDYLAMGGSKPVAKPIESKPVAKPIESNPQMPSIEDMKALYTKKTDDAQAKAKARRNLILGGKIPPMIDPPKKRIRVSKTAVEEPKKSVTKKRIRVSTKPVKPPKLSVTKPSGVDLKFDDLDEAIRKDRPNIQDKTITNYLYLINLISDGNVAKNLNWLINSKKIIKRIYTYPLLRQRDILNAVIVALKAIGAPERITSEYSNFRDDLNLDYFKSVGNKQQVKFWEKRIDERK